MYACMCVCTYVCVYEIRTHKMQTFCINDFIQLYCLRCVSNNQMFILRKFCTCSFMVVFSCIHINSLVDVRILRMNTWLFEACRRQYNWIKSVMKKVFIILVLITYVYGNPQLKKRKVCMYVSVNGVYIQVFHELWT